MGTYTNELKYGLAWLAIDEHEVGLNVAVSMILPLARKRVIAVFGCKREVFKQELQKLYKKRLYAPVFGIG